MVVVAVVAVVIVVVGVYVEVGIGKLVVLSHSEEKKGDSGSKRQKPTRIPHDHFRDAAIPIEDEFCF